MNKIFHYGIILFIIVGLIFNKQEAMLKALLQTPFDVFELCKTLILSICLWNGLLKIIAKHIPWKLSVITNFDFAKHFKKSAAHILGNVFSRLSFSLL